MHSLWKLWNVVLAAGFLVASGLAQETKPADRVTLNNGDVLTGTVKSLADGKLVIGNPALGDVTVEIAKVTNLVTSEPVVVLATDGTVLKRRIAGIENGALLLEGAGPGDPDVPKLQIDHLDKLNPPVDPPATWTGSFTLGGSYSSGNTDRRTAAANFEAIRRSADDRITVDATWDYGEDKVDTATGKDWNLSQRRTGGGLKYDLFVGKRYYILGTTRVLNDYRADLDLRWTAGAGAGYQLFESKDFKLGVEAGLSYFYEDFRDDPTLATQTPSDDYLAARGAYRMDYNLTADTTLIHSTEAFPSTEDADNVYFRMDTRLQTKLWGDMIGQLGWTWDYDNTPAPGKERSDHLVNFSVGWKF